MYYRTWFFHDSLLLSNIGNIGDHVGHDVDASEENALVEIFIVVMEQDRGVVHWGEADGWNSNLSEWSY